MTQQRNKAQFFDQDCLPQEQIPRHFSVSFEEFVNGETAAVRVLFNDSQQVGDIINDNAYKSDSYRFHDIFHFSFAALLGWSPCSRALLRRKRKSSKLIDEIEDGARATITEEALSMIIFNEAKRRNYFKNVKKISKETLRIIKEMTENFEVNVRTEKEWEAAILKAYEIFRYLVQHNGGRVEFDTVEKRVTYS